MNSKGWPNATQNDVPPLGQLPEPANLQLGAAYLAAGGHDRVGGDWFDAIALPDGSIVFIIGDVMGHDPAAAEVMSQLRGVLRGIVLERAQSPADVAARLDLAICDLRIDTLATMIVARLYPPIAGNPEGPSILRWSNAGHPAPIIVAADGTATALLATTDILLGVTPHAVRCDHICVVPAGATLFFYTDGLVESAKRDVATGQRQLLESIRVHHQRQPGDLVNAVIEDLIVGRPADDVAVLAARLLPTSPASCCSRSVDRTDPEERPSELCSVGRKCRRGGCRHFRADCPTGTSPTRAGDSRPASAPPPHYAQKVVSTHAK